MFNKKIIILTIFVCLLFISAVSANDNDTGEINVGLSNSSVVIEDVNATVGYESPLVARVTSSGSIVNEGSVAFYDDETNIGNSSVTNGMAILNFIPKTAGNHTVKAIFVSDKYSSSNFTTVLNVNKAKVDLFIKTTPRYSSMDVIINVTISSNSKPINEGTIDYYVNGNFIGRGYVYNGMQRMIYTLDSTGLYNLEVVFGGTTNYYVSSENSTFAVVKKTNITSSDVTTVYNGGKYLVATLTDVDGNPIDNTTLTIRINGALKSFITDNNGQIKLSTNGLAPNTYNAVIFFEGNEDYENSTSAVKVIVKRATPKLTAKNKAFKLKTKIKKYTIILKTNKNQVMKKVKVTCYVNGKTYKATTNNKGKATFKITKLTKKGKFNAVIRYAGSKYYNSLKKTVKITVKK